MPVSLANSGVVYDSLKKSGVGLVSALPETWLVHLIRMAEDDPGMILVRLPRKKKVRYFRGRAFCRREIRHADARTMASSPALTALFL